MSNFVKTENSHAPMSAIKVLLMILMDDAFIFAAVIGYLYTHMVYLIISADSLLGWVKVITIVLTFIPAFGLGCLKFYREWNKQETEEN